MFACNYKFGTFESVSYVINSAKWKKEHKINVPILIKTLIKHTINILIAWLIIN